MSSGHQTWEENLFDLCVKVLLPLAAIGAGIYFVIRLIGEALFWIWWSVPFALFYVVPLLILGPLLSFLWIRLCRIAPPDPVQEEKKRQALSSFYGDSRDEAAVAAWRESLEPELVRRLPLNYARLGLLIPATVIAVYALVDVPLARQHVSVSVGKGKQAHEVSQIILQWPWVYRQFNEFNSWWQGTFPILLQGKPYQAALFDRNDVSLSVWVTVLFGAPALFWFFSRRELLKQEQGRRAEALQLVSTERSVWEKRERLWKERETKFEKNIADWSEVARRLKTQVDTYRTREEHLVKPGLRVEEEKAKPGVLDSDLL